MGLDAWGVKLKDNTKWKNATWSDVEDNIDEIDVVPKTNQFGQQTAYAEVHHNFIKSVIGADCFTGDPCCSRETMINVSSQLQQWLKNNPHAIWEYRNEFTGCVDRLSSVEIKDLVEYITTLSDNGYVMWFSY